MFGNINFSHVGLSTVYVSATLVAIFSIVLMGFSSWAINTQIPRYYSARADVDAYNTRAAVLFHLKITL